MSGCCRLNSPSAPRGPADPALAGDADVQGAEVDDVVGVGDDEDLLELGSGELDQLLHQHPPPSHVLTAEDLVEDDEAMFGASLMGEGPRQRQAHAEGGEVLLAAREAL